MKKGDRVRIKGIDVHCTIHDVGTKEAHVWWPCPEFGLHEKLVSLDQLESVSGPNHGPKPKRLKDHPHGAHHNVQRIFDDLPKEPEPQTPMIE